MSVMILSNEGDDTACMYCTTSDWAFGPIFRNAAEAQRFIDWLPSDARKYDQDDLEAKVGEFRTLFPSGKHRGRL